MSTWFLTGVVLPAVFQFTAVEVCCRLRRAALRGGSDASGDLLKEGEARESVESLSRGAEETVLLNLTVRCSIKDEESYLRFISTL